MNNPAVQEMGLPFIGYHDPSPIADEPMSDLALLTGLLQGYGAEKAAHAVLDAFPSLGRAAAARPSDFVRRTGLPAAAHNMLQLAREFGARLARDQCMKREVLSSWTALIAYLRIRLANEGREQLRVLFLDKKNQIIRDECMWQGTIDHAPVYVREIIARAFDTNAASMIIVHNHPSGDPTPSQSDIQITRQLIDAAKPLNIIVHDHVIVGQPEIFSMKQKGLI